MKKTIFVLSLSFCTSIVAAQVEVSPAPKAIKSNSEFVPVHQESKSDLGEFERVETKNPDGSISVSVVKKGSAGGKLSVEDQIKAIDSVIEAIELKWKHVAADPTTDKEAKLNGWYTMQEAELKRLRTEKEAILKSTNKK